jgi:hypothetical protein
MAKVAAVFHHRPGELLVALPVLTGVVQSIQQVHSKVDEIPLVKSVAFSMGTGTYNRIYIFFCRDYRQCQVDARLMKGKRSLWHCI